MALSSALSNNAGFIANGPIAQIRTQDFEAMMRLNVTAVMIASREAHQLLKQIARDHHQHGFLVRQDGRA